MAAQNAVLAEEPPALQPVQSPEQEKQPTLVEGHFQSCEGHMERRSKILKRWKKEYIKVIPGASRGDIVPRDKIKIFVHDSIIVVFVYKMALFCMHALKGKVGLLTRALGERGACTLIVSIPDLW